MITIDIKMPRNCWECPFIKISGYRCRITRQLLEPGELNKRHKSCPLREADEDDLK